MKRTLMALAWTLLTLLMVVPFIEAVLSPLQQGRQMAYVVGGLSGVLALSFLLVQPLMATGFMPGMARTLEHRLHRIFGVATMVLLLMHIMGLYITSPDDTLDALTLVAPTPFSIYGNIGLWSMLLVTLLVVCRRRLSIKPKPWKTVHNGLAVVVVAASVTHSLMIEGAMGELSKRILCAFIVVAMVAATVYFRVLQPSSKHRG